MNRRLRIWNYFVTRPGRVPGQVLIRPFVWLHYLLFPLKSFYWRMNEGGEGYNLETGIWTIHGLQFEDSYFLHLALEQKEWFRVIKTEDGIITIEKATVGLSLVVDHYRNKAMQQ